MSKSLNYINRDFDSSRTGLINIIKQYYPNLISDFNDSSVGSVFIDLNSAIGEILAYHTDSRFQETQLDHAQERSSVFSMARTLGLKIPYKRPSVTLVDFSVKVPVSGDSFDLNYAPIIRRGAQVSGGGFSFETEEDIDFSDPFSVDGIPNRLIIPNVNNNNQVISYTLTKRVVVKNGASKVYKMVVGVNETKPFYSIVLPEKDVLSVDSIIVMPGTNITETPTDNMFYDSDLMWVEVDSLSEQLAFTEVDRINGASVGKWIRVDNKFITEYTDNGFMKITFGGGGVNVDNILSGSSMSNIDMDLVNMIGNVINSNSLGNSLPINHTVFVKYKIGGGDSSNVASGVITGKTNIDMVVTGPNETYNAEIKRSLVVNNPIPAFGGRSEPSLNEIKSLIRYNFSAQNRAVTLKDYYALIGKMPGRFGAPYRYGVREEQNKIVIDVLSKDSNGNLTSNVSSLLMDNIASYLSEYRMLNDYILVKPGKVINLGVDVDIMVKKNIPTTHIVSEVINNIDDFFNTSNYQMGDDIYISSLIDRLYSINGLLNIVSIKIENKMGGLYSNGLSHYHFTNDDKYYINFEGEQMIKGEPNAMYEIRFIDKDIRVRVK